ncbi:tRNA lysidine(34) synthetase TilS [Lactobacillus mulieris]|jgi:tRNA(ile)-lysidine synthetase|uniref:tRNA(Ile)-lysidine synthase n=1 Tax=Lactobacillus mulieris TaxID=2508708 RepID=A0AAP3GW49_9LACO|nr:tRNA lysidine(34) synthetase TilS [Lactobacillus mulieris]EEU20617.1 tRNA(Ile)-lysidine synthetase [Lactobacillus jensenii 27-2-CHN]EEX23848.1 tRNA(Ile)-lysidine synthetase [Lactobacillus jensenii 115-3-CHN]EFH29988.1 tRNA(Ile)-lysidine synthetase [Lactobacillus jensenii JV-V16]KAA9245622.1 tRNA lysidine(34) synthetase TilS [Lactobacillus jensenii]TRT37917.1 tRNA lysidine(34) synthetase TilS [Lactobacillus sp. c10Ua232AE]
MDKLKQFLTDYNLDFKNKTIIVACSAGPDSLALVDMLKNWPLRLIVAHFDHQIRQDSYLETELLEQYCKQNELPLYVKKWENNQNKTEAAARKARYSFLLALAKEKQADYLLTAHHGDDYLENIILKLIRSGDPAEMSSLQAVGQMEGVKLVRPLLYYSKSELTKYLLDKHLAFITDETNLTNENLRNRIRHQLIPLLKEENPTILKNGRTFGQKMMAYQGVTQHTFSAIKLEQVADSWRIKKASLASYTDAEKALFWEWKIWRYYDERVHLEKWQSGPYRILEYQDYVYLFKGQPKFVDKSSIKLDQPFIFQGRKYVISTQVLPQANLIGSFLAQKGNLKMGSAISGSKLPLKNGHHAKSKKFFAQAAIPNILRPAILCLYQNETIVFIEDVYKNQKCANDFIKYYVFLVN